MAKLQKLRVKPVDVAADRVAATHMTRTDKKIAASVIVAVVAVILGLYFFGHLL
jgi:hypothetical protein